MSDRNSSTHSNLIFDSEYSGVRHRYGLTHPRSQSIGGMPKGFIIHSRRDDPRYDYGIVDYPTKLDDDTADRFGMEYVGQIGG
jgi:hypothetical protein